MMPDDPLPGVSVLIPRRIRDLHRDAAREHRLDLSALVEALPGAPSPSPVLAEADAGAARDWIVRVIRALPTQADMEASLGVA